MLGEVKKILIQEIERKIEEMEEKIFSKKNGEEHEDNFSIDSFQNWELQRKKIGIPKLEFEKNKYQDAKSFKDLGMTLQDAMNLLDEHQIPVVLNESDKEYKSSGRAFQSKEDFICVHKTDYIPKNSKIYSSSESGKVELDNFEYKGKQYEIEYGSECDTVHTCINGEVASHKYGNWDKCKYAVMIPLKDIENEQIAGVVSVDLYTKGTIQLTENSWILCPRGQSENIQKDNPNVHVIEYEGEVVMGYAQSFVSMLGYQQEVAGEHGWQDREAEKELYDILNREKGISNIRVPHFGSVYDQNRTNRQYVDKAVSIYDKINKDGLLQSTEDIREVFDANKCISGCFDNLDSFFVQMEEIGLPIAKPYQKALKSRKEILSKGKEADLDTLLHCDEGATLQEQMTIEKLKSTVKKICNEKYLNGKEEKVKNVFERFMNLSAVSNMKVVKEFQQDNFKNMSQNFIDWVEKDMTFQETQSIFKNETRYIDPLFLGKYHLNVRQEEFPNKRTATVQYDAIPQAYVQYVNPYHSNIPYSSVEGKLSFKCQNEDGSIYEIEYRESAPEAIIKKNAKPFSLREGETVFDYISDKRVRECFEGYYHSVAGKQMNQLLDENLSVEPPLSQKSKKLSTMQVGKRTIQAKTENKQQIYQEFEQLKNQERTHRTQDEDQWQV